ncbi:expansin-A4-like [Populus alba x Populus x berolinensis]|uniref:Expansin n=1 Tax=Populus alba x Populus x berolinensis TaxID=444605 RepID=A0AAD6PUW3_9ROSI|nr:expansin-A4-like [Populus alba x Populus x berolinensis]
MLATLLLLAIAFPHCQAKSKPSLSGKQAIHHAIGRQAHDIELPKRHKPKFQSGPWKEAHATFYEGGSGTFGIDTNFFCTGGACNYKDVAGQGYGMNTAALSSVLFKNGQACGACFEIKCADNPQWCKLGQPSLIVTATDHCPNGGWCNVPREHFDVAKPVFSQLAEYKAGIIPIQYRRVPCQKQGGIRFTILGNPWFYQVIVWNVGGAGDVVRVQVKGDDKLKWTQMERDWGTTWKTSAILLGESLSFRVSASDDRDSTSWHVTPKNWQFGQTYEGKNFN